MGPIAEALMMSLFTWSMTALGASCVFFISDLPVKIQNSILGATGGIMIAASHWSLLLPAIELGNQFYGEEYCWIPIIFGFLLGGGFLYIVDAYFPEQLHSMGHDHNESHPNYVESHPTHTHTDLNGKESPIPAIISNGIDPESTLRARDSKREVLSPVIITPSRSIDLDLNSKLSSSSSEDHSYEKLKKAAAQASQTKSNLISTISSSPSTSVSQPQISSSHTPKSFFGLERRLWLLIIAIALHNFPEGLVVGCAAVAQSTSWGPNPSSVPTPSVDPLGPPQIPPDETHKKDDIIIPSSLNAFILAIVIAAHNLPEGLSVAFAMKRAGISSSKSFFYGQVSGIFQPIGAIIGVTSMLIMAPLLPWALSFGAGAIIFVACYDVIPDAFSNHSTRHWAVWGLMIGYCAITTLHLTFGHSH